MESAERAAAIGLDDLIALNDEIRALARAGLPLETGLLGFGVEAPGRLGSLARSLGARLERGETLPQALKAEGPEMPATYRAVVEAGLRSGRLAEALEDLAEYARDYADLRRSIGLAFLYPLLVLLFGWGLFIAFVLMLLPRILDAFRTFEVPTPVLARAMASLGSSVWLWGPIVPILAAWAVAWWVWSGRARVLRSGGISRWVPWLGGVMSDWRASNFSGWLALLLEHGVPLPESVELAGESSGDPRVQEAAIAVAEAARNGESAGLSRGIDTSALPPLLLWLIRTGERQNALVPALRHASAFYRRRAWNRAETLRTMLPALLLLGIGGLAALGYVVALVSPWAGLLRSLSEV